MSKNKDIDIFLNELINNLNSLAFDSISIEYRGTIKEIITSLERCKKEFHSNLFLILAFGPVKSGKSTLINLLSREEEVSPTKFGVECTLRPSIIIKAKNTPCIKRYISKHSQYNEDKEKENFHLVLDFLRGIADLELVKETVTIEEYELTSDKIQKYVAGSGIDYTDLGREPLITVIEVNAKNSRIIDDNTAVIDVPGLDGAKSNWRKSAVHDWILTRSDYLLFVQSSMAALNVETINFLKDVYINSKEPPMQLVQNIIEAKHWRGKEYLVKEAKEQRNKGVEQILDIIPYGRNNEFDSSEVNLGIAHDYLFKKKNFNNDNIIRESGYYGLETKLLDLLNMRREDIQLSNSLKSLKNTFNNVLLKFEGIDEDISKNLKIIDDEKRDFYKINELLGDMIRQVKTNVIFSSIFKEDYRLFLNETVEKYRYKFKLIFEDYFSKVNTNNSDWKDLERILLDTKSNIARDFDKHVYNYDSDISSDFLNKINYMLYKNIENGLFSDEYNLEKLLNNVKSNKVIVSMNYSEMIKRNDLGQIFSEIDIMNLEAKCLNKDGKVIKFMKNKTDLERSAESFKKSILEEYDKIFEREFKEKIDQFIGIELKRSIDTVSKDVQNVRESFDIRIKKLRDENLILKNITSHYRPLIEQKIIEVNQLI